MRPDRVGFPKKEILLLPGQRISINITLNYDRTHYKYDAYPTLLRIIPVSKSIDLSPEELAAFAQTTTHTEIRHHALNS